MNKAEKRSEEIMRLVNINGRLDVNEAVELLSVSEATVRRLFASLEQEGKVIRNYGGIQLPVALDNYSYNRYEKLFESEKLRIGECASQFVSSGDSIYLDCGTTVARMAEILNQRIAVGDLGSLTIVTNSIVNMNILSQIAGNCIILLGGEYNHERRDFSGSVTERCLEVFHFKWCFLGCEGLTEHTGYSSNRLSCSNLNRMVLKRSDHTVALTDQSKFGRGALASFADLNDIQTLVTDALPESDLIEMIRHAGTNIVIAEAQRGTSKQR